MIRPIYAVAVLITVLLAGPVPHGSAQPPPVPQRSQAALDEASRLSRVAKELHDAGKLQESIPLAEQSLALREKLLVPTHPDVARGLNDLAELYQDQGAFGKAEALQVRALAIREQVLGPMHPDVAQSLTNLAWVYGARGQIDKIEPLLLRSLTIREQALGPMHPDVAQSLNNLGLLYRAQGAHGKAEPLLLRALAIHEQALGPTHPSVAAVLNDLAMLYWAQGAYGKAEPLLLRALAIREQVLGPVHPEVAATLNDLAVIYQARRAYDKAEPLYVRALDIWEKVLGPMHPNVATTVHNLAKLYQYRGAYDKAEPLYVRALHIAEQMLGSMHIDVAKNVNDLATLYWAQGVYEQAEPLFLRALDIREKELGPRHPDVATSLHNLALLHRARGDFDKAEPLLLRAAEIREAQLRVELAPLSEPRKRALMTLLQDETDQLVSLHADAVPDSRPALELALTTVLRRKGRILDSLVDHETLLRAHLTPSLRDQLDQLTRARTELVARLYAPGGPQQTLDRGAIAAIHTHIEDLESALSKASADFRVQSEPVTVAKIQAALPRDAALVEFARYRRIDPGQPQHWQEDRYVAYLVTSRGTPQWVALGAAAPIDAEVDTVLAAMGRTVPAETAKAALQRLDALVFAPVRARLRVRHVILAPEGKLNLVPFEALLDPQGHYALDSYLVSYVTTGRDLLRLAAPPKPRSASVILASPDYGSPSSPGMAPFTPLAGALGEAMDLQRYFSTPPVTGEQATKSALAALIGPALLHVSTHGFYVRGPGTTPTPTPAGPSRGIVVYGGASPPLPVSGSEDPAEGLDRAGLAMAGANQGARGIVTAREIAGFDWWGTQLVVLSACETGVGTVSGDGVYGMRRALVLAGAAAQVVSLWNVSDSSARELMRDYYSELARGTGRAEALRRAKLRLMRQPGYESPYYWAAFIPAGDWRPLDKTTIPHRRRVP